MKAKLVKEELNTTLFNKKDRVHKDPNEFFCARNVTIEYGIGEYGNYAGISWRGKDGKEKYEEYNLDKHPGNEFFASIIEEIRYQDNRINSFDEDDD